MDRKRRRGPPVAQDSDEEESEYSRSTLRSEAQSNRSAPVRADDDEDDVAFGDLANAPAVPPGAMPPPPPRRRARRNRVQPGDAHFVADAPPDMDPLFLRRRFPLIRELTPEQAQALHQRKEARKELHRARALAHRQKRAAEMAAYIAAGGEPPRRSTRYESLIDQHEKWMRRIHEDEEKIRHLAQWDIDNEESAEADDRILRAKEEIEVIKEDIQSMLEDDPTLSRAYDHSAANIKWIAKGQPKGRGFEDGGAPPLKGAESKDLSGDEVKRLAGGGRIVRYPDLEKFETWDQLISNPKRAAIILFLTETETQGHWICAFEGPDGAHVFDPIGMALDSELRRISAQKRAELSETTPELGRLLKSSGETVHVSRVDFQKDAAGINTCGRWVGFRLKHSDMTDAAFANLVKAGTAAMGKGATFDDFVTAQTMSAGRGSGSDRTSSSLKGDGPASAPVSADSFQASSVVGGNMYGMGGWGEQILSLMPGYHSQEDVVRGASNGTIGTKHHNDGKTTLEQIHAAVQPIVSGVTPMPLNAAIDQSLKAVEAVQREKAAQKGGALPAGGRGGGMLGEAFSALSAMGKGAGAAWGLANAGVKPFTPPASLQQYQEQIRQQHEARDHPPADTPVAVTGPATGPANVDTTEEDAPHPPQFTHWKDTVMRLAKERAAAKAAHMAKGPAPEIFGDMVQTS